MADHPTSSIAPDLLAFRAQIDSVRSCEIGSLFVQACCSAQAAVIKRSTKTFVGKSVDSIACRQLVKLLCILTVHVNNPTGVRAFTCATRQRSKDCPDLSRQQAQFLTRSIEK